MTVKGSFDGYYEFRKNLVESLVRDLAGPLPGEPDDDIISDPPVTRYVAGILFPRDAGKIDGSEDKGTDDDSDEATFADPPVAMANVRYPSSLGVTFAVDTQMSTAITVTVTAARYERTEEATGDRWRRVVVRCPEVRLSVGAPVDQVRQRLAEGLELFSRIRVADCSGAAAVTLALINTNRRTGPGPRDALCFFQPRISVSASEGVMPVFVGRSSVGSVRSDEDVLSGNLLYRHRAAIAIGHGCSVEWEADSASDGRRAVSITTAAVPQFEMRLADSNPRIKSPALSMLRLTHSNRDSVAAELEELVGGYKMWISERRQEQPQLGEPHKATADRHLAQCDESAERMADGIRQLRQDADVWEAFRLANRAMLQQRARTVWLHAGRPTPAPELTERHQWRPFQLAFILQCIESISNSRSAFRDVADLLWFPTGGGKTEAYLGLIAFTVFLRRLRSAQGQDGVTAIMRYTLRLLTIQQFERAALLICCCEDIRRNNPNLGRDPITIGLWVGKGGTPNTLREARIALDRLREGHTGPLTMGNPRQLESCPWCGKELTPNNYYIADRNPRLVIACRNRDCSFDVGLPVYVVDEDIYNRRPALLIATADKFAILPWRELVANVFNRTCDGVAPPELIIQDELHLISGPLGTLTGLYEAAVDVLCTEGGARAKVIASTATIRRAQGQMRALFDRAVRQFPPPGLDARNSYFAAEADRDSKGTRLYLGLMAPGVSQTTLLVRAYAALLQYASAIAGDPAVRDAYWTLVGYFNSLRVLAGARMQVQDDVAERMGLLAKSSGGRQREIENRIELTSREPSGDIPNHLKRMAIPFPSQDALDVILATNMISVGVDIDRLGLMAVMGQPQTTSEYIQATSRVGRKAPGLVVVLFNSSRSRDRSHYESFVDYHSAIYRQVESSSATPFSARARDRGLHAVVVALARLLIPEFSHNESAAHIERYRDRLDRVKQLIVDRVASVDPKEREATSLQVEQIVQQWAQRAATQRDLVFMDFDHPDRALLVVNPAPDDAPEDSFATLWSLRDVDASSRFVPVG